MAGLLRRRLFWQIYLTLIASLLLMAVLAAVVGHAFMVGRMLGVTMKPAAIPRLVHILGFLLVLGGSVGVAAYPLVTRITRRLEALRRSVEAWDGKSGRAMVEGGDEIAAVARSFNLAAERAETLLRSHKTLLANASHELRSPLARLRMATELLGAGEDAGRFGPIHREIAELDGLVEEILLASRLDRIDILDTEAVDCLALVAEEAARAGANLDAIEPTSGPFEATGSARHLRRLIRNLIENALKHGAGPVEVAVTRETAGMVITVRDHGPGIDPQLRERVFEPFYRPSGRSEDAGSWGLGLALARQIARRHGGDVTCGEAVGGGAVFRVVLPSRRAEDSL